MELYYHKIRLVGHKRRYRDQAAVLNISIEVDSALPSIQGKALSEVAALVGIGLNTEGVGTSTTVNVQAVNVAVCTHTLS